MMLPAFCFSFEALPGRSCSTFLNTSADVSLNTPCSEPSWWKPTEETGLLPSSGFRVPKFVVGVAASDRLTGFWGGKTYS